MLMQLSLVGPPEHPAEPSHRERLRRKIHAVLSASLTNHDLTPEAIHAATEAVVHELTAAIELR